MTKDLLSRLILVFGVIALWTYATILESNLKEYCEKTNGTYIKAFFNDHCINK